MSSCILHHIVAVEQAILDEPLNAIRSDPEIWREVNHGLLEFGVEADRRVVKREAVDLHAFEEGVEPRYGRQVQLGAPPGEMFHQTLRQLGNANQRKRLQLKGAYFVLKNDREKHRSFL